MAGKKSNIFEYVVAISFKIFLEAVKRIVGILLSVCLILLIVLKDDPAIIKAYGDIFTTFLTSSTLTAILVSIIVFLFYY